MDIFNRLQPLLNQIILKLNQQVQESFPLTLKDPIKYFLATPSKKVRPLLTVLSAQAVGGTAEAALPAAVGIELFHDFTLIHDDIMDKDELRRGRPTIHTKWDEGTAILAGDALIGMASASMSRCPAEYLPRVMHYFSEALIKVCEGQALDKEFEHRKQVSLTEYLDMISKKTAWLFQHSCRIGAILGGGNQMQIQALSQFGYHLGMGFQIQDDLLDFVADETTLGKKVGSDFRMDKKTYITLKYREYMETHPETSQDYPGEIWQFDSLDKLKKALFRLKIVEQTQAVVDEYFRRSLQSLGQVQPIGEENNLSLVIRFLQTRQY